MRKVLLLTLLFTSVLVISVPRLWAQTADMVIRGVVTDVTGMPLPGASVSVKNTRAGATTDVNGRYTITVPQGATTLTVSFIGMVAKQVNIGTSNTINVTLSEENTKLNEVVVVGYGVAKRVNLTTAQTSVSSKELSRTVNTTLEQALQGRAAGVYITQNSGQPGGGISVSIRGVSSLNGTTEPLYVIDGVIIRGSQVSYGMQSSTNPLAGLNPADIEDMQILKGPSATSIYGSMGTNGVVLVTTKRGKAGDVKVNYGYQYSLQTSPGSLEVMSLRQYAQMVKEFHSVAGGETPQEFLDPSLLGEGTDWQKALFRNAPMQKHQLSLSGGNDKATYYLSGDYLNQDGVAEGSGFDRYSFRLNLDSKPKQWMTLGANLSFNQTEESVTSTNEDLISSAIQLTPQIPVKNLNGSWGGGDENNGANKFAPVNPIALANINTNEATRRQFLGGLNMGVQPMPGLSIRTSVNINLGYSNSIYFRPTYKIGWAENTTASLTNGNSQNTYWNWNQQVQYTKQVKKHSFDLMFTHESQKSTWRNLSGSRTGFLTNDVFDLEAGDPLTAANGGGSGPWSMESYLGRLNYNFEDKYLLTATYRTDGSSNFGENNRWGKFPSVSAAWRISKEKFFNVPAISDLKLRFETGVTGNQGDPAIFILLWQAAQLL
ncbi:SusC/RagA family TonB-linked outer membrane protein [Arcticibacter sp. MXS-1]|uniref:SusC/RagA family TonB-linked outer membrane protein n=1 Tax=Arcticibacter sp. MXS-1 TaxID=3341726 RepID=UPI0035A85F98